MRPARAVNQGAGVSAGGRGEAGGSLPETALREHAGRAEGGSPRQESPAAEDREAEARERRRLGINHRIPGGP